MLIQVVSSLVSSSVNRVHIDTLYKVLICGPLCSFLSSFIVVFPRQLDASIGIVGSGTWLSL